MQQFLNLLILRDYLRGYGLPVLALGHEYSLSAIAPLKIRIESLCGDDRLNIKEVTRTV